MFLPAALEQMVLTVQEVAAVALEDLHLMDSLVDQAEMLVGQDFLAVVAVAVAQLFSTHSLTGLENI
jgi:hypothetical protein